MERDTRSIQSVERAMQLLELLSAHGGSARLSDLVDGTGLGKSTVHGMLNTLVGLGYVTRDHTRYVLGLRLEQTAQPLRRYSDLLRRSFTPALLAFNESCGENCFLTVSSGTRAYLTLHALDRNGRPLKLREDERRDALTRSAAGKIFLAYDGALARRMRDLGRISPDLDSELSTVGVEGFALDVEASKDNLNCVALPLRLRGKVVASLSASGSAEQLNPDLMRRLARRSMRSLFELVKL